MSCSKHGKKGLLIGGTAAVLLAAAAAILFLVPTLRYNAAVSLMGEQRYEEAASAFEKLGDYKDSRELMLDARYEYAQDLLENKAFDEAAGVFETLGEHKDSGSFKRYAQACALEEDGDLSAAMELFEQLGSFRDSREHFEILQMLTGEEDGGEQSDIALTINGAAYTVADVTYYYQNAYQYEMSNGYGSYFIDTTTPLNAQAYIFDSSITWADYFKDQAVATMRMVHAIVETAKAEGVTLNAEYRETVDSQIAYLQSIAETYNYSYEELLHAVYGSTMDPEAYQRNLENHLLASQYTNDFYNSISFTDAEVEEYYQNNIDTYGEERDRSRNYNIRHILITEESLSGGETDVLAMAQTVLSEWAAGEATEASFAALAAQYTQDPGSAGTGGLYEDVPKGRMIAEFENWCYAEGRKSGDTGIVETSYGFHIMYFVGYGEDEYWYSVCLADMKNEVYSLWETALLESFVVQTEAGMDLVY